MKFRSIALSSVIALSVLSPVLSVYAIDEKDAAMDSEEIVRNNPCKDKTGTMRGKCIGDVLNAIARWEENYFEEEREKTRAWKAEFGKLGLSPEYYAKQAAFNAQLKKERDAFRAEVNELRKKFHDEQKAFRAGAKSSSSSSSTGYRKVIKKGDNTKAMQECADKKDSRAKRICLRKALETRDPAVKGWVGR